MLNFDGGLDAWSRVEQAAVFPWEAELNGLDKSGEVLRIICLLCSIVIEDTAAYLKDLENTISHEVCSFTSLASPIMVTEKRIRFMRGDLGHHEADFGIFSSSKTKIP